MINIRVVQIMFIYLCLHGAYDIVKAHNLNEFINENTLERFLENYKTIFEQPDENRIRRTTKIYFEEENGHEGAHMSFFASATHKNEFIKLNGSKYTGSEPHVDDASYKNNELLTTDSDSISSDFNAKENRKNFPENSSQLNVPENSFNKPNQPSFKYSNNHNVISKQKEKNGRSMTNGRWKKFKQQSDGVEDTSPESTEPPRANLYEMQKNILNLATNYGLEHMHYLYEVKEKEIYDAGIFLPQGSPGSYLATFNQQTEEVKNLSKYGFAALRATARLRDELANPKLRQEIFNVSNDVTKDFPEISLLDTSLHDVCPLKNNPRCPSWNHLFRTIDGTCNNLKHLWWGSRFQPLKRFLAPDYADGLEAVRESVTGGPLPSPRLISTEIHWDKNVNSKSVTHMLMQWGQFIDHDMTSSSQSRGFNGSVPRCCNTPFHLLHPDCLPIEVPPDDNFFSSFGIRCLEFLRSAPSTRVGCGLGPREQINQVTSYIDGSMIYGNSEREAAKLRLFRNGMLKYSRMPQRLPLLPQDRERGEFCRNPTPDFFCLFSGDGRMSEQPGLMAIHVIFLRFHNRLARHLSHLNPDWEDERLYQETRKIVGAVLQHITYREFLPIVLGQDVMNVFNLTLLKNGYYTGYNEKISGTAANAFASAAFRFGHSMVQGKFLKWDDIRKEPVNNISLHDELQDPGTLHRFGAVDNIMMGLAMQEAQKRDEHFTEELTNHLFQTPRFPAGLDLAAINIQRGRDHGLPSYNAWRNPCGLRKIKSWDDLLNVMPEGTRNNFRRIYRDVNDIDLFPAGLSEFSVRGGIVGSTFACIIAQHFRNLRKGDRFWYENGGFDSSFTLSQLKAIRRVTLARILCDNLDLIEQIQPFVFLTEDNFRNPQVSCRSRTIPFIDLSPWVESVKGKWDQKVKAPVEISLPDMPESNLETTTTEIPNPIDQSNDLNN